MLAGGYAVHQVIGRALRPGLRNAWVGEVGSDRHNTLRKLIDRAPQATHLPATSKQLPGQATTYIATTYDHCGKV